jgi:hypothetical protein
MTAVLRRAHSHDQSPGLVPPRTSLKLIVPTEPSPAAVTDTTVHPVAVAIPLVCSAWFLLVSWVAFAGGETSLVLAVVTLIGVMFLGLVVGGGALARDMVPMPKHRRSFQEFLNGNVEIATGRVRGNEALLQIAALPVSIAIGATIIAAIAVSV